MNGIRAPILILTFVAASAVTTEALANSNCAPLPRESNVAPFVVVYEVDRSGTKLRPVLYEYKQGQIGDKIDPPRNEYATPVKGELKVNGAICATSAVVVERIWNHDVWWYVCDHLGNCIKYEWWHPHPHP